MLGKLLNLIAVRLFAEASREDLFCVIRASAHSPLLSRARAGMIISRVRLVSAMFAILTPLWIVVDFFAFTFPLSITLAIGRLVTTLAFVALLMTYRNSPFMKDAYRSLAVMFIIPTGFFFYSHLSLSHFEITGGAGIISAGYAFLPFVLVAGLSVFPLTALEGIIFSLPVLFSSALVALMQGNEMNWSTHIGAFWLLMLIAVTATLAGMSQLALMAALVRQANHDPLTRCYNRASGEELFNLQISIAERNGTALSVVFADLDNFKEVNDTYGHDAGDQVLISTVAAMRDTLRAGDVLIRWGGEEFLMVLPNTDCASAVALLQRLRTRGIGQRPNGTQMTASFGVAERVVDCTTNSQHLIDLADKRMYLAKRSGKDRWISCEDDLAPVSEKSCQT